MSPSVTRAYGALTPPSPKGVRAAVGKVLHAGVLASAAIILAGYVLEVARSSGQLRDHAAERAHLAGLASFPHSFAAVASGLAHGQGAAVIVAGLLALILTPVAGLFTGAVAFARRHDWAFTTISATVLAVILGSFLLGALAT